MQDHNLIFNVFTTKHSARFNWLCWDGLLSSQQNRVENYI